MEKIKMNLDTLLEQLSEERLNLVTDHNAVRGGWENCGNSCNSSHSNGSCSSGTSSGGADAGTDADVGIGVNLDAGGTIGAIC